MTNRALLVLLAGEVVLAQEKKEEHLLRAWRKIELSEKFFCEGANFGDFNRDGKIDIVSGPYWYAGPDFKERHEVYPVKECDPREYSDNFFSFTYDFNKDGWTDILVYGFPGKDASWYENPQGRDGHWKRHKLMDVVDNESPTFVDVNGDGVPDLVCSTGGRLGYFTFADQKFHPISPEDKKFHKFAHGLGVGDINGDGRMDVLEATAWWEQPADLTGDALWKKHDVDFGPGGAQMYAYDVDGDGVNDVITSLEAHGYGLAWFKQARENGEITFKKNIIVGKTPEESRYGVKFSQMHAVDLIDIDGDGVKDIVTGKRWWAQNPKRDKDPTGAAVLYWFRIVRTPQGPDFVPYLIDDNSGIGTQVVAGDILGNKLPGVVIGNKKGTFPFIQESKKVSKEEWEKAQPRPH